MCESDSRLRGEVGERSEPGEGDYRDNAPVVSPPHPDPLPASGARERTAAVATIPAQSRGRRFAVAFSSSANVSGSTTTP